MGNTKAMGRRGRVLKKANERAQRRFHDMFEAHVWSDPYAKATRLYLEAERLVDAILLPAMHPTPIAVVVESLRWPVRDESDKLAEYWNTGA